MVKGVQRHVVVVRCPDTEYFDQAIFMVRDDRLEGKSPEQVLAEARRTADRYIRHHAERKRRRWPIALAACLTLALLLGLTAWLLL